MINDLILENCINTHCPWSKDPVTKEGLTWYRGQVVGFCNSDCREKFEQAVQLFESHFPVEAG